MEPLMQRSKTEEVINEPICDGTVGVPDDLESGEALSPDSGSHDGVEPLHPKGD